MMDRTPQPAFLMCSPDFYGVEYVINPWMDEGRRHRVFSAATAQWIGLRDALTERLGAEIRLVSPTPGLPDMVFTANAGLVAGRLFVPSRFRHRERAGEEAHFAAWAEEAGYSLRALPSGIRFEGAGDALFDRCRPILWLGHGFRTDEEATPALEGLLSALGFRVVPLRLVDPRFYHLDTCLCPLSGGYLLYYPAAFAPESLLAIEAIVPREHRIPVSPRDADGFACNAVNVESGIVLNTASEELRARLAERGFRLTETPLSEFIYAGGAAKCLTLRLGEPLPLGC